MIFTRLQDFGGHLLTFPDWFRLDPSSGVPSENVGLTMDGAGEYNALKIQIPRTGTLKSVEFYNGAYVAGTFQPRITFEDPDSSGLPDGTADQYRDVTVSGTGWIASGIISSDGTDTGTKRSVTKGNYLWIKIKLDTRTSGSMRPDYFAHGSGASGFPWVATYNGVTTTRASNGTLFLALKYDDDVYTPLPFIHAVPGFTQEAFQASTNPDERGMLFGPMPFTGRLWGVHLPVSGATNATWTIKVYDSSSTLLASQAFDNDDFRSITGSGGLATVMFASQPILRTGRKYRVTVLGTGTGNQSIYSLDYNSQALAEQTVPWGTNFCRTTRNDGGSWTEDKTKKYWMSLVFDRQEVLSPWQ